MAVGRDPRATVRIGALERTLEGMNVEMGAKVAQSLAKYHETYVRPLEERIAWLETSWYVRLWLRLTANAELLWFIVRNRLRKPVAPIDAAATEAAAADA